MLVDDITIHITAGKGGDGVVAFNKNMMELGPTGGSGGKGGNVCAEGISDIGALKKFRFQKKFKAADGKNGLSQIRDGADGDDLILTVPVGTVIHNLEKGSVSEVEKIGKRVLLAKGGEGGRGNFRFRSSRNTSPEEFEHGKEGDSFEIRLELKLIADVGFVGLPNVGKSSLLNEITRAKSKVANYPFTTLEPNLGAYYELIIADIPGLIKGASLGKGLGIKFLRHIERTRVLFHFISSDSENPLEDYGAVRRELGKYNKLLLEKPEYIVLSKRDNVLQEKILQLEKEFKGRGREVFSVSILEEDSLKPLKEALNKMISEKKASL